MELKFDLLTIIILLGSAQGVFLSLALFSRRSGSLQANKFLGVLTFVFSMGLFTDFLVASGQTVSVLSIHIVLWPEDFLYGPLLYLYVRELTLANKVEFSGKQLLHFSPAALHALMSWSLLLLSTERQVAILISPDNLSMMPDVVLAWLLGDFESYLAITHVAVYLLLSLQMLRGHSRRVKANFSFTEHINLNWLKLLLAGMFGLYFIWVTAILFSEWLGLQDEFSKLLDIAIVIVIYSMGYLGLRQPNIFSTRKNFATDVDDEPPLVTPPDEETRADSSIPEKYKKSSLSSELSQALLDELLVLMKNDKPYLDSQLSLPQLASSLNVPVNYISQVINEKRQQNFFDFINGYRIDEAKQLLSQSKQGNNILTISMEVGFNSKSVFYTAFKKVTNMTPTQYRKQAAVC